MNRSLRFPLFLLLAANAVMLSTGCGGSRGEAAPAAPPTAAVAEPAAEREGELDGAARTEALEQRVHELEAQLDRRAAEVPAARPARPTAPRPRPTPAPTQLEAEAPVAQLSPPPLSAEAAPEPESLLVKLETGTELQLTLREGLSSETSQAGDPIFAVVARDVFVNGVVAVAAGSEVYGSVVETRAQKKIGGQARLALRFDKIRTPDGYEVGIQSEAELLGQPQKKKDAATIGGAAAGGALLGRILSKHHKGKGTVLGAAVGAAVGTAVASQNQGDPVVLEPGAALTIQLELPVHVAVAETD